MNVIVFHYEDDDDLNDYDDSFDHSYMVLVVMVLVDAPYVDDYVHFVVDDDDVDVDVDDDAVDLKALHNYAASRINLPIEALNLINEEIAEEENQLESELDEYTSFINIFGYMIPFIFGGIFMIILVCYIT
eukprot:542158_1